jgi:hypothetical protein
MPTGACGINCDVCKLRLLGICSSCGSGKSLEAKKKLEAQKRIFGGNCTILACANLSQTAYCLRDCESFPCENFTIGPYPFSQGFLNMQTRRLSEIPPAFDPHGHRVKVPSEYWDRLQNKDINTLCNLTLGNPYGSDGLILRFLNEDILVDIKSKCIRRMHGDVWEETADPLLELVTLLYLGNVKILHPLGKDIVSKKDLKEAHFFIGSHDFSMEPLVERYGDDMDGFKRAAEFLEGKPLDMADVAFKLSPFPRIPLYYLFWKGDDEEFEPKISVLFDRSIEEYFSASATWGLVNRVSLSLLIGPKKHAL